MAPKSAVLLVVALAALAWFLRADLATYRLFRRVGDPGARRTRYRLWLVRAWLGFAVPALLVLLVLKRTETLVTLPPEFAGLAAWLGPLDVFDSGFLRGALAGAAIGGILVGTLLALRQQRRGRAGPMLGNIAGLLPRHRGELPYVAALSITAGITEELFFRLALPLLIVLVTGQAWFAFAVATLLFGYVHRYQGWVGVLATTVMGVLFAGAYLASGSLWVAMAFHAFIDLNGLVLRPLLTGVWRARA